MGLCRREGGEAALEREPELTTPDRVVRILGPVSRRRVPRAVGVEPFAVRSVLRLRLAGRRCPCRGPEMVDDFSTQDSDQPGLFGGASLKRRGGLECSDERFLHKFFRSFLSANAETRISIEQVAVSFDPTIRVGGDGETCSRGLRHVGIVLGTGLRGAKTWKEIGREFFFESIVCADESDKLLP